MQQDKLWQKLEAFEVGTPGAALGFVDRLARENGWTKAFAQTVFLEYKKFLYLIATSGRELTPSDAVDQAWHLHLVYTRSYWQELCDGILGFPLHHQPTRGGAAQQAHYKQTYQHTFQVYRQAFRAPPADIWPDVEARFHDAVAFVRVNRTRAWLVPKPMISVPLLTVAVLAPALLTACGPAEGENPFWFWLKVGVGMWGVYIVLRAINKVLGGSRPRGGDGGGFGCSGCGGCGGD